jgi:hypothetical protein
MQKLLLLSGIAFLNLTSISLSPQPAIAGCGLFDITCKPSNWTCPPGGCVEESTAECQSLECQGRGSKNTPEREFYQQQGWQAYPGGGLGQTITISQDGSPLIIGTDQRIYRGSGSGWVELSGSRGKNIAFDGSGKIWIIGTNNAIYSYPKSIP